MLDFAAVSKRRGRGYVPNRRAVIQGILGLGVAAGKRVLLPGMACWGGERLRDAHADVSVGGSGLLEALPGK